MAIDTWSGSTSTAAPFYRKQDASRSIHNARVDISRIKGVLRGN
jgi:hypothetical protein